MEYSSLLKLKEDSLDDFDIHGEVAAANAKALKDEDLQSKIKKIKTEHYEYISDIADDILGEGLNLSRVFTSNTKAGEYWVGIQNNMFGGSCKIGDSFYVVIHIGNRDYGVLPEHKKMDYEKRKAAIQRLSEELKEKFNKEIKNASMDGYNVFRLSGYGDVIVRSSSDYERESICLKIRCKIS